MTRAENALNLTALSRQLAANTRHAYQYGALIFHGAIIDVNVNCGNLRNALHHVNPMAVRQDGVLKWRGCGQQIITIYAVAATVYSRPDKDIKLVSVQLND